MDTSDENKDVITPQQEAKHDDNQLQQAKIEEEFTDTLATSDKKWAEKPGARADFNRGANFNDDVKEESKEPDENAAFFDEQFNMFSAKENEIRSASQVMAGSNEETKADQSDAQAEKAPSIYNSS